MEKEEEQQAIEGNMDTIEDCEKMINETHWVLIAFAGLMLVFGTILGQFFTLLPDVVFMVVLALLLKKYQSRTLSVLVFLYSIGTLIVTFGNRFHIEAFKDFGGGSNIFLAIFFVTMAFRSMMAAFKLFKLKNYSISWKNFMIKTAIFIAFLLGFGVVFTMAFIFVQSEFISTILFYLLICLPLYMAYAGIFPKSENFKIKYVKEQV